MAPILACYLPLFIAVAARLSRARRRGLDWRLWTGISVALAALTGIVQPLGVAGLVLVALAAIAAGKARGPWRVTAWLGTMALCVALGAHALPGIWNPFLYSGTLSPAATEYRLFWNFDKGFAGLMLLQLVPWQPLLPALGSRAWKPCSGALALAIAAAVLSGMTRWDPKLSAMLLLWAPANLFVVCVPEEALFRMLIQGRLEAGLLARRMPLPLAVGAAAALFGLVHFRGGPWYMVSATLAGAAYGFAYQVRRNPWHPVLLHFGLNLVHFLLFAYPFAKR